MKPELQAQLLACKTLPSPPGVASRIVDLANDPNVDMDGLSKVLGLDPALTTKVLRLANSAMYAQRRKTENLRQAIIMLGLNATMSLALSFSLLKSWQSKKGDDGLDYPLFWRRALLAATCGRKLAAEVGIRDEEELFLTCLIQDIGMLALARSVEGLYAGLGAEQRHERAVIGHEREQLGVDHAAVGGWLLKRWNFPDRIQQGVAASHDPERVARSHEHGKFARCVAVSSLLAEVFLEEAGERRFQSVADAMSKHLGIGKEALGEILRAVSNLIPDVESVFGTEILGTSTVDSILDEAKEALLLRNLRTLQVVDTLNDKAQSLETRTRELEESNRRDGLTGLFNRSYLNDFVAAAFIDSNERQRPLSIAFADLDRFKSVNDTYGHQIGDRIIKTTGTLLQSVVRSTDVVARYGGEEFVLVFPNTSQDTMAAICERIVETVRSTQHDLDDPHDHIAVTISIGMATHGGNGRFETCEDLVQAADKALYTAKLQGRDRSVRYARVA